MSESYDDLFENPTDQEYVTRSALPNGGVLNIIVNGDDDIANQFIPEAKRNLGTLQMTMAAGKVTLSTRKYVGLPVSKIEVGFINGIEFKRKWNFLAYIEIFAVNGYGTSPDQGTIRITTKKELDEEGSSSIRSIGYIYQCFLPEGRNPTLRDRPNITLTTPSNQQLTNLYATWDRFEVGGGDQWPDHGAKYIDVPVYDGFHNAQEVFLVIGTRSNTYAWDGPQTIGYQDPAVSMPSLTEGWELLESEGAKSTGGSCGASAFDTWYETTFSIYPPALVGDFAPNRLYVHGSMGILGDDVPDIMRYPDGEYYFGWHYSGGHHPGIVWVPGIGDTTAGCIRDHEQDPWGDRYDDVHPGHAYEAGSKSLGAFAAALSEQYSLMQAANPDTSIDEWTGLSNYYYTENPIRNKDGLGFIINGGWDFSQEQTKGWGIRLQYGNAGFGEASLIMLPSQAENMDFTISQDIRDEVASNISTNQRSETVGRGTLSAGSGFWRADSTFNENVTWHYQYSQQITQRFGMNINVEPGVHRISYDDYAIDATIACWVLVEVATDGSSEMTWTKTFIDVGGENSRDIEIYVGPTSPELLNSLAYRVG